MFIKKNNAFLKKNKNTIPWSKSFKQIFYSMQFVGLASMMFLFFAVITCCQ